MDKLKKWRLGVDEKEEEDEVSHLGFLVIYQRLHGSEPTWYLFTDLSVESPNPRSSLHFFLKCRYPPSLKDLASLIPPGILNSLQGAFSKYLLSEKKKKFMHETRSLLENEPSF